MDWLQENWQEIVIIILAGMELARRVVKLTPTPKDDAAVEKIGLWLKALAFFGGVDPKNKK